MPLASFKDLSIDAGAPVAMAAFWASVLGRNCERSARGAVVTGRTSSHTIWVNEVPEARTVKNRVHLDIYATGLGVLERLGASVLEPQGDRAWTVMADPEGGEFCAFLRDELPAERLHGLVVDCADAETQAAWWAGVYGAELVHHPEGYSTVQGVVGMPIQTMDFVPVPEAKSAKNRVHWDVTVPDLDALLAAGASLVRAPDREIGWHVLEDPEGNEFCAFSPAGEA